MTLLDQLREWRELLAGLGVGAVTAAGAVLGVRRLQSRERLQATRDRVESTFTVELGNERASAVLDVRQALNERAELLAANARLQALATHQAGELERQARAFASWRRLVLRHDPKAAEWLPSSIIGLDQAPPASSSSSS